MQTISPLSSSASTGLPVTQWSQYHGDASHSGYSSYPGPTSNNQLWSLNFGGTSDGLVAGNGFLVVASPGANGVSAVNETSGRVAFKYSLNGCYDNPDLHDGSSYPAVGGGEVFLSDVGECGGGIGNTQFRADNSADGSVTYQKALPNNYSTSSLYAQVMVTYSSGAGLAAPFNTHVLDAFLASTGTSLWLDNLGGSIDTIPTVGDGVVAVGFSDVKNISGINAQNGNKDWSYPTDAQLSDTPAFAGGAFYFGTLNGTLYSLSSTGEVLWKTQIGSVAETTPAVAGTTVLVGSDDGYLRAYNVSKGNKMWELNLGSSMVSSPVVSTNGIVYEATSGGPLYALNITDGNKLWSYPLQTAVVASPVLDNGDLFVVDQTGTIHAFGTPTTSGVTTTSSSLSSSMTSSSSQAATTSSTSSTMSSTSTSTGPPATSTTSSATSSNSQTGQLPFGLTIDSATLIAVVVAAATIAGVYVAYIAYKEGKEGNMPGFHAVAVIKDVSANRGEVVIENVGKGNAVDVTFTVRTGVTEIGRSRRDVFNSGGVEKVPVRYGGNVYAPSWNVQVEYSINRKGKETRQTPWSVSLVPQKEK